MSIYEALQEDPDSVLAGGKQLLTCWRTGLMALWKLELMDCIIQDTSELARFSAEIWENGKTFDLQILDRVHTWRINIISYISAEAEHNLQLPRRDMLVILEIYLMGCA